jgi:hypothetical protein
MAPVDISCTIPAPFLAAATSIIPISTADADFSRQFETPKLAKIAQ